MTEGRKDLTDKQQAVILEIIRRGSCAEVRQKSDGAIIIYEVKKNKVCWQ